jgi:hypothetical protein
VQILFPSRFISPMHLKKILALRLLLN